MRISYQYKLRPTKQQIGVFESWLDKLRCQYNYLLEQRFDWWEQNRCAINACPLICHLPELKDNPSYYDQKKSLVKLKEDRPWYQEINAQVLQNCVERVHKTMERFLKGDKNGKRSGRPRFKGKGRYRSFTYPQLGKNPISGNLINLSKIGWVKMIVHRPLPEGFVLKTATVSKKADGWYISLSRQDKSVPDFISEVVPTKDNSIGVDLGLEKIVSTSTHESVAPPKHFRIAEQKLSKLQRRVASKPKRSKARAILNRKIAKLHQKIARQRKQFHFETVKWLLSKAEVVFIEDLQVKNMLRRCKPKQDENGKYLPNGQSRKVGLNKSFADAGLSQFVDLLSYKAEKAGLKVIKVDPKGTSQYCSSCLNRVSKELSDRWHCCYYCGLILDRDVNSAILIQKVGMGIASLKNACSASTRARSQRCTA
ncbi:transposase [Pleurocapsales cyanobacterium LEGE 06147]|nr:transposase [Pleurocapsales cyanobacterium LEGE 06147]